MAALRHADEVPVDVLDADALVSLVRDGLAEVENAVARLPEAAPGNVR